MAEKKKPVSKPTKGFIQGLDVSVPDPTAQLPATVTELEVTTAREVYKESAKDPDAEVLRISFEGEGFAGNVTYSAPGASSGKVIAASPKASLNRFVRTYGPPKVGQRVSVAMGEDGYWKIALPE